MLTPTSSLSLLLFTTTSSRPSAGSDLKFLDRLDVKVCEGTKLNIPLLYEQVFVKLNIFSLSRFISTPVIASCKSLKDGFQVDEELERTVNIKFPKSVTRNGSLYLSVFALPALGEVESKQKSVNFKIHKIHLFYQVRMSGNGWWQNAISHPHASYSLTSLTQVTSRATESIRTSSSVPLPVLSRDKLILDCFSMQCQRLKRSTCLEIRKRVISVLVGGKRKRKWTGAIQSPIYAAGYYLAP